MERTLTQVNPTGMGFRECQSQPDVVFVRKPSSLPCCSRFPKSADLAENRGSTQVVTPACSRICVTLACCRKPC